MIPSPPSSFRNPNSRSSPPTRSHFPAQSQNQHDESDELALDFDRIAGRYMEEDYRTPEKPLSRSQAYSKAGGPHSAGSTAVDDAFTLGVDKSSYVPVDSRAYGREGRGREDVVEGGGRPASASGSGSGSGLTPLKIVPPAIPIPSHNPQQSLSNTSLSPEVSTSALHGRSSTSPQCTTHLFPLPHSHHPSHPSPTPSLQKTPTQLLHPPTSTLTPTSARTPSPSHSTSPLPSLSQLRNLQRANSAAGRLMAMKKLMGETPPSPTSLRRAGSLNTNTSASANSSRGVSPNPQLQGQFGSGTGEEEEMSRGYMLRSSGSGNGNIVAGEEYDDDDDEGDEVLREKDVRLAEELRRFGEGMLNSPTKRAASENLRLGTAAEFRRNRMRRTGSVEELPSPTKVEFEREMRSAEEGERGSPILGVGVGVGRESSGTALQSELSTSTILAVARPRLVRANTVGTGGGEERRSVIGRRMMERLGNRVARQEQAGNVMAMGMGMAIPNPLVHISGEDRSPDREAGALAVPGAGLLRSNTSTGAVGMAGAGSMGRAGGLTGLAALAQRARERREAEERARVEREEHAAREEAEVQNDADEEGDEVLDEAERHEGNDSFEQISPGKTKSSVGDHQSMKSSSDHLEPPITSGSISFNPSPRLYQPEAFETRFERDDDPSSASDGHSSNRRPSSNYLDPNYNYPYSSSARGELDRTVSRMTARSGVSDTFEYEAHLRRSGSLKRDGVTPIPGGTPAMGYSHSHAHGESDFNGDTTVEEILHDESPDLPNSSVDEVGSTRPSPAVPGLLTPGKGAESTWRAPPVSPSMFADAEEDSNLGHGQGYFERSPVVGSSGSGGEQEQHQDHEQDLLPPLAPFVSTDNTPERGASNASNRHLLGHHSTSPSASSMSSSINGLFIVGAGPGLEGSLGPRPRYPPGFGPVDRRDMSMSNFPAEIAADDGRSSGFGTPAKRGAELQMTDSPLSRQVSGERNEILVEEHHEAVGEAPERPVEGMIKHRRLGSAFKEHLDEPDESLDDVTSPAGQSDKSWHNVTATSPIPTETFPKRGATLVGKMRNTFKRARSSSRGQESDISPNPQSVTSPSRTSQASSASGRFSIDGHSQATPNLSSVQGSPKSGLHSPTIPGFNSHHSSILSQGPAVMLRPGQASPMPRMAPNDARALDPKLSAFVTASPLGDHGPLLQQASDSAVPTLAHSVYPLGDSANSSRVSYDHTNPSPAISAQTSYYDLTASRSTSPNESSIGKKSWLAETFFTGPSAMKQRPSISDMLRRKGSASAASSRKNSVNQDQFEAQLQRPLVSGPEFVLKRHSAEPAALTPTKHHSFADMQDEERLKDTPKPLHRMASGSPAISTVLETAEDRSTIHITPISPTAKHSFFSQTSAERDQPDQPIDQAGGHVEESVATKPINGVKSNEIMNRLDKILLLNSDERPDVLDDPPRSLVASLPALQVTANQTVKDRHLFLFSDILVLAKPLDKKEANLGLDGRFSVKAIVPLQHLTVTSQAEKSQGSISDQPGSKTVEHPVVRDFIQSFARDPQRAIAHLQTLDQVRRDPTALAKIFYKTPELDREQVGRFLSKSENSQLLQAFVARLPLREVRIDEAVRVLLQSVRLPAEATASKQWLQALAHHWQHSNALGSRIGIELPVELVWQMIISIMQLNDSLHPSSSFGFSFPNSSISEEDFIQAFSAKDPHHLIPQSLLSDIYTSIRFEPLSQALPTSEAQHTRHITLSINKLHVKVPLNKWSDPIYISIPDEDAGLEIRLMGAELIFDRPVLRFSEGREAGFRVMGTGVGASNILFHRCGANANRYPALPPSKSLTITPPLLNHTITLTFPSTATPSSSSKRSLLFSLPDAQTLSSFHSALNERINRTRELKGLGQSTITGTETGPETGRRSSDSDTEKGSTARPWEKWEGNKLMTGRGRWAADLVSLRVLRETLLEEPGKSGEVGKGVNGVNGVDENTPRAPGRNGSMIGGTPQHRGPNQPSGTSTGSGAILSPNKSTLLSKTGSTPATPHHPSNQDQSQADPARSNSNSSSKAKTGKDLVLICRQNSLLPVVLGLVRGGDASGTGQGTGMMKEMGWEGGVLMEQEEEEEDMNGEVGKREMDWREGRGDVGNRI